jgi:sigma-B regulation protein RsbU (phosphoserine phosphatase)
LVQAHARPSTIVRKLNSFIWRHFRDSHLLVSFFVSRIDLAAGRITYSSAGHPAQLLIRRGTGPIERLTTRNLLIGVDEDCLGDEPERDSKLRPTDRLVFFTDGVTETMNREGEFLGEDGLARIAAAACCPSLSEMADCVLERVNAFRAGPMRDDMTLILADFCPSRDPDVGS